MGVTVITRAAAKRLTTSENAKLELGRTFGADANQQLDRFIDAVSAQVATFCRRTFGREVVRERLERSRLWTDREPQGLRLSRAPVVRIVAASMDGNALTDADYELDGGSLFFLREGLRRCWPGRFVVIDYEAGWLLPGEDRDGSTAEDLPADLERAVIQLVGAAMSAAGRDALVKSETVEGVGSTDWYVQGSAALLAHPEAEAALMAYRRGLLG